jgi:8-amino-7-oxononanoate synthase
MNWMDEITCELNQMEEKSLKRSLREVDYQGAHQALIHGKQCVLFCTNNYLGLSDHPEVQARSQQALQRYGTSAQASPLISGYFPIHRELSSATAKFKGAESCLIFPTGFMANLSAIASVIQEGDIILEDRLNHASLIDAAKLSKAKLNVYHHCDMNSLEKILKRCSQFKKRLIVTDALFSMDGDVAPLADILSLAQKYEAMTLVDDAHGTGILGPGGQGIVHHLKLNAFPTLLMGTYSKALASLGGFICASQTWIDYLVNRARPFIYTTGLPPAVCGASLGAIEVIQKEPERVQQLWKNAQTVRQALQAMGFKILPSEGPIIPIWVGKNEQALDQSTRLLEKGILVVPIRPPTVPSGTARLRISVSATHTPEQLEQLITAFKGL